MTVVRYEPWGLLNRLRRELDETFETAGRDATWSPAVDIHEEDKQFIVRADPGLIMIGNRSMQTREAYPGWDRMRAVRAQRVCVYGVEESDVLVRPGPRMAEAAQIMARCVREKLALPLPDGDGS